MWTCDQVQGTWEVTQLDSLTKWRKQQNSGQLTFCSKKVDPGYNAANVLHLLRSIVHRRSLSQTVVQLEDYVKLVVD